MAHLPFCKYMRMVVGSVLVLLFLQFLLFTPALAGNVAINCTGSMHGDVAAGNLTCTGGVSLQDGDTVITGDTLIYDRQNNTVQVQGDVAFTQGGMKLTGQELIYNIANDEGTVSDVTYTDTPAGALSPVYVSGDSLSTCPTKTVLNEARLTTCDPKAPGYYLAASRIEIFPNDKIVLYGIRFIESGLTLYYWPKLVLSLNGSDTSLGQQMQLPSIGQSATEGWFIKNSFAYRGPGTQYGKVLLDYMTLLGWGIGINHTFRDENAAKEAFQLYVQPNKAVNHMDVKAAVSTERELPGAVRVTAGANFTSNYSTAEQRLLDGYFTLGQTRAQGSSALSWRGTQLAGAINGYEVTGNLSQSQSFAGGWRLRLDGSVQHRERSDMSERHLVGYLAEVSRTTTDYSLVLGAEDRFNPDLSKETPPEVAWNSVSRLPELQIKMNNIKLGSNILPFTLSAGFGKFTETRDVGATQVQVEATRSQSVIEVKPIQLQLGWLGQLRWNGSVTRSVYGSGQARWLAGAQGIYTLPIGKTITLSGDYHYNEVLGDISPFKFDQASASEQIQGKLDFNTTALQLTASSGYNLRNSSWMNMLLNGRAQLGSIFRLQAQTEYNTALADWTYAIGTAEFKTKDLTINLGAKYNLQNERAERVDGAINWDLHTWKISYSGIYNAVSGQFDRGDFAITRNLGCRSIDLRYNQPRKEIWLEYHITAFPQANLKLGANEQRLMFDLSSWEELLGN